MIRNLVCRLFCLFIRFVLLRHRSFTPHDTYLKLYAKTANFDKHIALRYDKMSGSRYFITVAYLFCEGILTREDISLFSEEVQQEILRIKKMSEEND